MITGYLSIGTPLLDLTVKKAAKLNDRICTANRKPTCALCLLALPVFGPYAREQFEAELALDTPEPRTYLQLGHTYVALEKSDVAIGFLQRTIKVTPDSAGAAWVDIGRAYRQLGRSVEAAAAFERGIALGERKSGVYYKLSLETRRSGNVERAREALAISQKLRDEEKHSPAASHN